MITLDGLLDKLKASPRTWTVSSRGVITCNGWQCVALWANSEPDASIYPILMRDPAVTGEDEIDMTREVFAANDNKPGHLPSLRRLLLEATGLAS